MSNKEKIEQLARWQQQAVQQKDIEGAINLGA